MWAQERQSRKPFCERLKQFWDKPWLEKRKSIRYRLKLLWNFLLPFVPLPVKLDFGFWWLAWNDYVGDSVFIGVYEEAETKFVERFLKEGMTVIDIGAHYGLYTLLASRKVGATGKVIAFEPSPRELRRLILNLKLNRCFNVKVEPIALGNETGIAEFFLADAKRTGCSSLRAQKGKSSLRKIKVPIVRLDDYLMLNRIENVDFIKVDAEGAELEILKGSLQTLSRHKRPIWLAEVRDICTQIWGYKAKEILSFLLSFDYLWFVPLPTGQLSKLVTDCEFLDGNFVAVPKERLNEICEFLAL